MSWVREPAVAGRFYPADPILLSAQLSRFLGGDGRAQPAPAVVAPHAGYVYSGAIAGAAFANVDVPERVVVLCPNHTGLGARRSVWPAGEWRMPGGALAVDEDLATLVREEARLEPDRRAHLAEHSAEVHLPFLRAKRAGVRIVPVCLGHLDADECLEIGAGVARAVRRLGGALLVASTDMSHYVPAAVARRADAPALERMRALDAAGLHRTVRAHDISMCGYVPTAVVLAAARALGARQAQVVRYGHSGEASGDDEQVVAYAAAVVA